MKRFNVNLYEMLLIFKSYVIKLFMKVIYHDIIQSNNARLILKFPYIRGKNGTLSIGKGARINGTLRVIFDDKTAKGKLIIEQLFTAEGENTIAPRGGEIIIGTNCFIGTNVFIQSFSKSSICIGNNVMIAANTVIVASNHIISDTTLPMKSQGEVGQGIVIEDDVWVGANVVILDGVTVGIGSVIAAGSVVNKGVEPYSIVAGVPAKKIKGRKTAI